MSPTVALTTTITLDGETRTLKYGLLAFKALNLNPFDVRSIEEFKTRQTDLAMMADLIHAGLLHEYYGKGAPRRGQIPPTPNDLLADYDLEQFTGACNKIFALLREDAESVDPGNSADTENPPSA